MGSVPTKATDRNGNEIEAGSRVRVMDARDRKRWYEEEGTVLCLAGTAEKTLAVVHLGRFSPLFPVETLEALGPAVVEQGAAALDGAAV